ncbi:RmlC-like cupin domain-containing protein [Mycena galericulata]|nr:RmlC-like cupin domain-containing protein [Mycena galericulata]
MPLAPPLNFPAWLKDKSHLLKPPVNNFCLYQGSDFVVMAVGGPNERNDYHVNETEVDIIRFICKYDCRNSHWIFRNGSSSTRAACCCASSMAGVFRDIRIEEGEMFLLPANTPHNPVRFADTIGIVMERVRPEASTDRLRWYCRSDAHTEPTVIYEESFHVTDLGTQLKPVIQRWQADEKIRTCGILWCDC